MQNQTSDYETVAEVASFTNPDKSYAVKKNLKTGRVSCDCPAWIFQKGGIRNDCKHIRSLLGYIS